MESNYFAKFYIVETVRKDINTQDWNKTLEDVAEDDLLVFSKTYEIFHRFKTLNNIYRVYSTDKKIFFKNTFLKNIFQNIPILKIYFPGKLILKVWLVVIAVDDKVNLTRETYVGGGNDKVIIPKNAINLYFNSLDKNKFIILTET